MFIRTSIGVPVPAGAHVPLPLHPLQPRPPGRLAPFDRSEMNTSHSADGTGVHLSPQSFDRSVPLQPSPQ
jgi:hypothetical protein